MKLSRLFWIGLTITTSFVIFVFGLMYLQDISLNQPSVAFTVMFDNVQGLNEGDDVNMLGKRIGKVRATRIMGSRVAVEVGIDQSFAFNIPIDSQIEVKSDGLMGARFISIKPGVNTKSSISNGEVIDGKREVGLGDAIPDIQPITNDLAAFSRNLRAILDDNKKDEIKQTLSNVESISSQLDSIIKGVSEIVEGDMKNILISNDDRKNISEFFENLNATSKNLKTLTSEDKLISTIDGINELTIESQKVLKSYKESGSTLNSSIASLNKIVKNIENGKGSIGKLLSTSELSDNINNLIKGFSDLVDDFEDNKSEYFYKYYKATRQAEKDIKKEEKKKK